MNLSVRRAALSSMSQALRSWRDLRHRIQSHNHAASVGSVEQGEYSMLTNDGILDRLSDVFGQKNYSVHSRVLEGAGVHSSVASSEDDSFVVSLVDWAVMTLKTEPDDVCRAFLYLIIQEAIDAFDTNI